jgi:peptidoglycan/LPS O-acetylase OafA/YrhL
LVLPLHTNEFISAQMTGVLPFLQRGYLGVDLFFVLFRLIVTHVYLTSFVQPNWYAIRVLFWHRLVRLYPVHVPVLAAIPIIPRRICDACGYMGRSTGG